MVTLQASGRFLTCLLIRHGILHEIEILRSLACGALRHIDASHGLSVVEPDGRELDSALDLVVESEIFVDVCCGDLTACDGLDDRCGTRYAVTACENAVHLFEVARVGSGDLSSVQRNAVVGKVCGLDALADGYEDTVTGKAYLRGVCIDGCGTTPLDLADDLGLYPEGCDGSVFLLLDLRGSVEL